MPASCMGALCTVLNTVLNCMHQQLCTYAHHGYHTHAGQQHASETDGNGQEEQNRAPIINIINMNINIVPYMGNDMHA